MRYRNLLSLSVLISAFSCQNDAEFTCSQYFITQESSTGAGHSEFRYNTDGLLSSIVGGNGGIEIRYSQDKLIKDVFSIPLQQVTHEFFFDPARRLAAIVRYRDNVEHDSMAFEYDGSNRLSKRSIFNISSTIALPVSYFSVEYPRENLVQFNFFEIEVVSENLFEYKSSFVYTIDGKKKPYPDEYNIVWLSRGNTLYPHNALSLKIIDKNGNEISNSTYEYSYNSDGYPLQQRQDRGSVEFKYACEPSLN